MLILLPPSEGKASEGSGPPVGELSFPALDRSRRRVLNALVRASKRRDALDVLGLTPGLAGELAKNVELKTAPTLPAAELYTGVLYDNLGLATLSADARRRAEESLVIFSGLWGVVKITDHIPPYRLSMGVNLPPLGGLAAFWRAQVTKELDRIPGLVVDLRSSTYAGAWQPGERSVTVRVFRDGKVVSHMAKATRGEIARALLSQDAEPATPDDLAKLLDNLGHTVTLTTPTPPLPPLPPLDPRRPHPLLTPTREPNGLGLAGISRAAKSRGAQGREVRDAIRFDGTSSKRPGPEVEGREGLGVGKPKVRSPGKPQVDSRQGAKPATREAGVRVDLS